MKNNRLSKVAWQVSFSLIVSAALLFTLCYPPQPAAAAGPQTNQAIRTNDVIERKALNYLRRYVNQLENPQIGTPSVTKIETDDLGMIHVFIQQSFNDVRMWSGEAIVHINKDGSLFTITDNLVFNVEVNTTPNITAQDAKEFALARFSGNKKLSSEPATDLWVFRGGNGDRLTWRVRFPQTENEKGPTMPVYFVDAQTNTEIGYYDNLQTQSSTGSGVSLYSGTVPLDTFRSGTTYYLEDTVRKVGTFNYNNSTTTQFRYSDLDNLWDSAVQRAGVDAQYGAIKTYDYFKNVHGRNGIDGSGGPGSTVSIDGVTNLIGSRVHYSTNYNNAFWNGQYMTYGDGDGTTFTPLVTLDIAGHEMTHGITERTAGLVYSGESGALNESMSDVFGAMVERYALGESTNTWKIGEQAYTPNTAGDALRYMDNPHLASNGGYTADDDPDHYNERYTGSSDNGGVHINSGIANKAFYLVAKGGTHHLSNITVTGIGADAAAAVWYKALTTYMTSGTNFAGARTATLNAAAAIYGNTSAQYTTVATAWCAVGVGTCAAPPPTGTNLLVNGSFETSVAPWVMSGTGALYTAIGNYPQTGTGYIYFGGANSVTGQNYQQITIPSGGAPNLSFYLNVTSAETTTTTQYDKLNVEIRNSTGTLLGTLATFSNLNKVATAGSYTLRGPYSLAAYAGQTVRVQFSTTCDSTAITTFRLDTAAVQ